jgi:hypothetical protein
LEVPNADPVGNIPPMDDGMGDMPMGNEMPPMNGNGMDSEPPIGSEGPDDMGSDMPPMDDKGSDEAPVEGNSEIDDIFSKLNTEDQASVIKYAKSMVKDNGEQDTPPAPDMQAESVKKIKKLVTEIVNNILGSDDEESQRPDNQVRNKRARNNSPFVTKY